MGYTITKEFRETLKDKNGIIDYNKGDNIFKILLKSGLFVWGYSTTPFVYDPNYYKRTGFQKGTYYTLDIASENSGGNICSEEIEEITEDLQRDLDCPNLEIEIVEKAIIKVAQWNDCRSEYKEFLEAFGWNEEKKIDPLKIYYSKNNYLLSIFFTTNTISIIRDENFYKAIFYKNINSTGDLEKIISQLT